jgi:endoglucanase
MRRSFRWISLLCSAAFIVGCAGLSLTAVPPEPTGDAGSIPPAMTASPEPASTPAPEPLPTPGEPAVWPDAFTMNALLGRGVNFGNALEGDFEGAWGVVLRDEYFEMAAEAGFDTIRLPIRWNAHALESAPFTIDADFFDRVDWAVDHALSRGMNIILDFHHFYPYMECPTCERNRFLMLWQQIAAHYQDSPPGVVFELLNEPENSVPAAEWNAAVESVLPVVRATNPDRTVIVGPVGWNSLWSLSTLHLPEADRGLIVTFHYYDPFTFTHQGAEWADGSDAWLGTTWTGTAAEEAAIRHDFDSVAEWGAANDRPIFLGEFGAYQRAPMDSRARWTDFVAREAEARGFSWAYWEFCAGFGVYDPETHAWRDPLLEALLP